MNANILIGERVQTPLGVGQIVHIIDEELKEYYHVKLESSAKVERVLKHDVYFFAGAKVITPYGQGIVKDFREKLGIYKIDLPGIGVAFLNKESVHRIDFQLMEYPPQLLGEDEIYEKMRGIITRDQATRASALARKAYKSFNKLIEDNSSFFPPSPKATTPSLTDSSLHKAVQEVESSTREELKKLMEIATDTKTRLLNTAEKSVVGQQSRQLLSRSKEVLHKIGCSTEASKLLSKLEEQYQKKSKGEACQETLSKLLSLVEAQISRNELNIALLHQQKVVDFLKSSVAPSTDPVEILRSINEMMPSLTTKAAQMLSEGETFLERNQNSPRAQAIVSKANEYIDSVETGDLGTRLTQAMLEIDVKEWSDWGEELVASQSQRQIFVDKLKDQCLDYLMSALPSIPVPPIEGVKDDIDYVISGLELSEFSLKKENVAVQLGSITDVEVLKMTASGIRTLIPNFQWSFNQKVFPFFNGGGSADATMSGGEIALGFKAQKVLGAGGRSKPQFTLSSVSIDIHDQLTISTNGSWFSLAYNLLATIFGDLIKEYITCTLESALIDQINTLIQPLNDLMEIGSGSPLWPIFLEMTGLKVDSLPLAEPWRGAKACERKREEIDLTFHEKDLGINFEKSTWSRHAVVMDKKKKEGGDDEVGMNLGGRRLISLNGLSVEELTVKEIRSLLDFLPRPITLRLTLPFTVCQKAYVSSKTIITFGPGPLGLKLRPRPLSSCGVVVSGFLNQEDGKPGPAEIDGRVVPGHLVHRLNGQNILHLTFEETLDKLKNTPRPISITFANNSDGVINFKEWPPMVELSVAKSNDYLLVSGFIRSKSRALQQGLRKGDILISINHQDVSGKKYSEVVELIGECVGNDKDFTLSFRPNLNNRQDELREKIDIHYPARADLSFKLKEGEDGNLLVEEFVPLLGPAEKCGLIHPGLAILQVCKEDIKNIDLKSGSDAIMKIRKQIEMANPPYSLTIRDLEVYEHLLIE